MPSETFDDVADYLPRSLQRSTCRPHSALGYLSPQQSEDRQIRQTGKAAV
jgi:transposase InsO family protein